VARFGVGLRLSSATATDEARAVAVEKAFDVERTPVPGILAGIAGVLSPVPARGVMSPFDKRGAAAVTAVVLIGGCAAASAQDDGPAVLPYRPSVASPADLPAHGWPELEAGLQWTKGGNTARSKAALMTFKNASAAEEQHYTLYQKALETLKFGRELPETRIFVCGVCGCTVEGESPEKCPICGAPKNKFTEIN
jgi:hypothetical protein